MLQTIQAEIDANGHIRLLETVAFSRPRRALLTILEDNIIVAEPVTQLPDVAAALAFLRERRLPADARPTAAEIEANIAEARDSWE